MAEAAAGVIRWAGNLAKGETLSITFTVTVEEAEMPYNATITNTVVFTSDNAGGGLDEASFRFRLPYRVLLLMIMKNYVP
jgi:hypothetical protein